MVLLFSLLDTNGMGKTIFNSLMHAIMMFICGRKKDDYLIGAVPQPTKEGSKFKGWKVENNMVMS